MSAIEQAKGILDALRVELKQEKEAVLALLREPRVTDWQGVDLKHHRPLFDTLGIDSLAIGQALADYPAQAREISRRLAALGNEIGNQWADLMDCRDPDAALARVQELAGRCRLANFREGLQVSLDRLFDAHRELRQHLDLSSIINLARNMGLGKKELFPEGMSTLLLLSPEAGADEGLDGLRREPGELEIRFQRLEVTRLPRLAEEIVFAHIEAAMALCREIGHYLDTVAERLLGEIEAIAALERGIAALKPENPARLVAGIAQQAGLAANLISALYHKRQLKDTLATVVEALDALKGLHLLLATKILPGLQQEATAADSLVNPVTIAGRLTRSFFLGPQGIIRSFKLMLGSLTGKTGINEVELQLLLEEAIRHCKIFSGSARGESKAMQDYIDSLVGQHQKPFPYHELTRLTRRAIIVYGAAVEKFIHEYEVPPEMHSHRQAARVGGLLDGVARHRAVFQKVNAEAM